MVSLHRPFGVQLDPSPTRSVLLLGICKNKKKKHFG